MSSYFTEGANIPWSRDEISGCDCNEKTYRHVHCPCFACSGRATDRKTELRHWKETCQLAATNSASVVTNDISFENVGECDQPVEDEFGAGCNPEPRRDLQQSDRIDDDEAISTQNPMKKLVVKAVLEVLRIMHMSSACPWGRTPGQPGECVGEYKGINWLLCPWAGENSRHCFEFEGKGWGNSKFCKITDANHGDIRGICRFPQPINTGDDVDSDILSTLWPKSWNDVQLLLKEEDYEDAKQYFICFCREEKEFTRDGKTTKKFVHDGKCHGKQTRQVSSLW
ncbi:hypothetical protein P5673_030544 [Acropora cervicornis]|uniref:Uncharacterized protein n=1 Tax=Acropora cervicornis TaxID=6130 RepID=A0AAD9PUL3_ACRCE|nr:hypothetical protein P5673_030544 [Acropora cervicornis]